MATISRCSILRTALLGRSTLQGTSQRASFSVLLRTQKSPSSFCGSTCPALTELRGKQPVVTPMATGAKSERRGSRIVTRAVVTESSTESKTTEGKLPESLADPITLNKDTLRLALDAALLSSLAYKQPVQVEYLRMRANGMSQQEALEAIRKQAGGKLPGDLDTAKVSKLEDDNTKLGYTDILARFDEPSQYFDGKQSLFMEATVAYLFFCPTPKDQRNIIYVVFRGTEGKEDLVTDIELTQVEIRPKVLDASRNVYDGIGKIMLHLGFRDQYVAVSTALTRNVEAAAREVAQSSSHVTVPDGPARLTDAFKARVNDQARKEGDSGVEVVVAGHSLGAALATIGSFVSCLEHPDVRCSYFGFGSPRVGNANFAEMYKRVSNGHVIHFANKNDPVTGVPIPINYVHVLGGHMLEEVNGGIVATAIADEGRNLGSLRNWVKNNADYLGWFTKQHGAVPWSQHDMSLYVRRVRALYDQAKAEK